jgi:hypothetical protein
MDAGAMTGFLIFAAGAALITSLARSERNHLGHPAPKQIIRVANASFRDAKTPTADALLEVSSNAISYLL